MKTFYCGIDAGSSNCHVAVLDESGKWDLDVDIPTSELHLSAFFGSMQKDGEEVKVHLEAGCQLTSGACRMDKTDNSWANEHRRGCG